MVVNKIDRADARPQEVLDEVYDLFIDLGADEDQLEFPVLYAIGRDGVASPVLEEPGKDLSCLFDLILERIPGPRFDPTAPFQMLVSDLGYSDYLGRLVIGKIKAGLLQEKADLLCMGESDQLAFRPSKIQAYEGLQLKDQLTVEMGDIVVLAGLSKVSIGDTICLKESPVRLKRIDVDEPTVSMRFTINTSPFAGREGKIVQSRKIKDRLEKEALKNVALRLEPLERKDAFEIRGRGELQMAVLIETMRREGYECMVSRPQVITRKENGKVLEPFESVLLDVPEEFVGILTEKLALRKGRMTHLANRGSGRVSLEFIIPARGLIGFRSHFMTDTKGAGVMNTLFEGYQTWAGPIAQRISGALVADRAGRVTTYASLAMADRGEMFVAVGTDIYGGMIVGERNRTGDLNVNIVKEKKLTNIRSSTAEATVNLRPPRLLSLDQSIEFIAEDELVEITPLNIRLRKMNLAAHTRPDKR